MLNVFEDCKNKCKMYWPMKVGQTAAYGRVKIKLIRSRGGILVRTSDLGSE